MRLAVFFALASSAFSLPQIVFKQTDTDVTPCALVSDGSTVSTACALATQGIDIGAELTALRTQISGLNDTVTALDARLVTVEPARA